MLKLAGAVVEAEAAAVAMEVVDFLAVVECAQAGCVLVVLACVQVEQVCDHLA
jgi:hypothetical protein